MNNCRGLGATLSHLMIKQCACLKKNAKLRDVIYCAGLQDMMQLCCIVSALPLQVGYISRPTCQFHSVSILLSFKICLFANSLFIRYCCASDSPCKLPINCCLLLKTTVSVIRLSSLCYMLQKSPDTLIEYSLTWTEQLCFKTECCYKVLHEYLAAALSVGAWNSADTYIY